MEIMKLYLILSMKDMYSLPACTHSANSDAAVEALRLKISSHKTPL